MTHAIRHLLVEYRPSAHAAPQHVTACLADGMLQLVSPRVFRQIPLAQVPWPDARTGGRGLIALQDGSQIRAVDPMLWEAWLHTMPVKASAPQDRAGHRGWLLVGISLILIVAAASACQLARHWHHRQHVTPKLAAQPASIKAVAARPPPLAHQGHAPGRLVW